MQKHEKERDQRRIDDFGGSSGISLTNSMNNSRRIDANDINLLYQRGNVDSRKLADRRDSGLELKRSLIAQQVEQEQKETDKMHRYLEKR